MHNRYLAQFGGDHVPLILAPQAGVSESPFRRLCRRFGADVVVSEFVSAEGLRRGSERTHAYLRFHDDVTAVAVGLERTGRIVTAAAVLIAVVFLSFALGRVSFIKMFGLGLTLAVVMDAFLIRGTLVPAFMRLAGRWNWWSPAPLRRIYQRWGISESVDLDGPAPAIAGADAGAGEGAAAGVTVAAADRTAAR